jgi:hypothetical protein
MGIARVKAITLALPLVFGGLVAVDQAAGQWRAQPRSQTMRYAEMDDNGDGVITRSEWRGTRQAFNAADINSDGVLSGSEVWIDNRDTVGTSGTLADRRAEFNDMDDNGDGVVSRNEWRGSRYAFTQQDVNNDGVITRREYVNDTGTQGNLGGGARQDAQQIYVNGRSAWTNTGLRVNQGDTIMFNTQGSVQLSSDSNDSAQPAGSTIGRRADQSPLPNELAGALIGRIGNSPPFGVGNQRQITAPASGELFLGVNDDFLNDNNGGFRVRVSVR